MASLLALVVLALALAFVFWLGRSDRIRSRTTTRRFLGVRYSARGIFGLRSIYIPLPFGYRIQLWEKKK